MHLSSGDAVVHRLAVAPPLENTQPGHAVAGPGQRRPFRYGHGENVPALQNFFVHNDFSTPLTSPNMAVVPNYMKTYHKSSQRRSITNTSSVCVQISVCTGQAIRSRGCP